MGKDDAVSDREIFRAWARGLTEETLADTYGLEVAEVRQKLRAEKEKRPNLRDLDPLDVFRDHTLRTESAIEEFAALAAREKGLIRVRAVEGRFLAMRHLFEIHQAAGVLPRDLGQLGVYIDVVETGEALMNVLKKWDPPVEVWDAIGALDPKWSLEE